MSKFIILTVGFIMAIVHIFLIVMLAVSAYIVVTHPDSGGIPSTCLEQQQK